MRAATPTALGSKGVDPAGLFVQHGGFWRFDPDKLNQDQLKDGFHFSTGLRHALSVAWNPVSKSLFVATMGRDQLNTVAPDHYTDEDNARNPAEEFHILKEGSNFGWPFTYWDPQRNVRMIAPEFGGDNRKMDFSGKYPRPLVAIPAHWAPMQMLFYTADQFPQKYRNGAFIATHGSWNRAPLPQGGYNVIFIPFDETGMPLGDYFEIFADGFAGVAEVRSPRDARYRPCGIALGADGSLYVADSDRGRVWRIFYTGESKSVGQAIAMPPAMPGSTNLPPGTPDTPGSRIYAQACAVCHMGDGNGVPNLQPPLRGSTIVTGDPTMLIRVVLEGATKVMPTDRPRYSNTMPPMDNLTDEQIAAALTFVRQQFADAPPVQPEQVARVRSQIKP
jgi:cytochrome c5